MSTQIKTLISEYNSYDNCPSQVDIITIIYGFLHIIYGFIPKNLRRQANAMFVWYPKEREDLKMIHNENNVLTDDELIIAKSMHAFIYDIKIHMDLRY